MKIRFLGTGSCESVPALFCNCPVCEELRRGIAAGEENALNSIRTRTQTMIDDEILIDFNADTYYHALKNKLNLSALGVVLLTHTHEDHFYPQDLALRCEPYAHNLKYPVLTVYCNEKGQEAYDFYADLSGEHGGKVALQAVQLFKPIEWNGYRFTPLAAHHMRTEQALLWLVEKGNARYLCGNDTGMFPEETFAFLEQMGKDGKPLSLIALDCALGDTHYPYEWHLGVDDAAAIVTRLKAAGTITDKTHTYINHISHDYGHKSYAQYCEFAKTYGLSVSRNGLVVEVEE